MGSQNSEIDHDQFRQTDWQERQKEMQFQVWKSRTEPFQRLEQYEVLTQNDDQLRLQRKAFELRRRNPLLVASHYFQSYPKDNFCSTTARHSLFIERIPIRLQDVEHVPYPDYLHIFDTSLKGYAQLARFAGFFPVDEGMIGINDDGVVKVWLNEYLASNLPFGKATEAQMVASLIQTIDSNIDHDQLPSSSPSVRNFLYRNSDALTFDVAIRQFGQFVRRYNSAQIPIRLECIDQVGGVYAIANRDRTNSNLKKSNVGRSRAQNFESIKVIPQPIIPPIPTQLSVPIIPPPQPPNQIRQTYLNSQARPNQTAQVFSIRQAQPIRHFPPPPPPPTPVSAPTHNNLTSSMNQMASTFQPRASTAIKFTVEVTPGKVYPQKHSTIFMNGSSKVIPSASGSKQVSLLDNIHPRIATSQKEVLMPIGNEQDSLKIIENGFPISHTINEAHEDAVKQDTARHSSNPAPHSKRSLAEVFIPEEELFANHSHEVQQAQPTDQHGYNFVQFKDAVSVAQQSDPNSLVVSFNPAFEEVFVNRSNQILNGNDEHYPSALEDEPIAETGKFAQTTRRTVNGREEAERDVQKEDDRIRETGKFNLKEQSTLEDFKYLQFNYGQNGYNQAYNNIPGYLNFNEEHLDYNSTEQAQIDLLNQYIPNPQYAHYHPHPANDS